MTKVAMTCPRGRGLELASADALGWESWPGAREEKPFSDLRPGKASAISAALEDHLAGIGQESECRADKQRADGHPEELSVRNRFEAAGHKEGYAILSIALVRPQHHEGATCFLFLLRKTMQQF